MQGRVPPRWYFGWNIVAAASFLTLLTVGMRMGVGPFLLPMMDDLGLSRSELSFDIAVGMVCYGLAMPLAGYLIGRFGTRPVLLLGTTIVVVACVSTANATGSWAFLMIYGVLLSFGLGLTSPVALTPILARWFTRRRGMALFFLSTGSMAGIAVMTPVFAWTVDAFGWRQTMVGFGLLYAAVSLPLTFFVMSDAAPPGTDTLGNRSAQASVAPSRESTSPMRLRDALSSVDFQKLTFGLFSCGFSMNLLGTHGMPMLMDHGFDATSSSTGIGLIGLVAIFGTLLLGRVSDEVEKKNLLATIYLVRGLGFFALVLVGTHWELYLAAAVGGIVWAGSIAMSSAILASVYGVRLVGVLYGLAYLAHQVGAALSSWFGGWGYEQLGSHLPAFGAAGVLLLLAAGVSMTLPVQRAAVTR